jgi:hypothetical protein
MDAVRSSETSEQTLTCLGQNTTSLRNKRLEKYTFEFCNVHLVVKLLDPDQISSSHVSAAQDSSLLEWNVASYPRGLKSLKIAKQFHDM